MRRTLMTISTAAFMFGGLLGTASASQPANAAASCVAVITSYEASQLPAASVGREVSGLAKSAPGLGQAAVSPLAQKHLGSIAACAE
ncbi:MAG: hypothetical protein LC777_06745 [Actinobacteria bacterium]|nr:hypothetical protein [Actinomycetota bacterium]